MSQSYEMYTAEGDAACEALVQAVGDLPLRTSASELRIFIQAGLLAISKEHPGTFDSEPPRNVYAQVRKRYGIDLGTY